MVLRNIEYWEKLLENMPESYKKWFKEEKKYLVNSIPKNSRVLEVGCGDGRSIRDILVKTKNVVGIDHDKKAVAAAKRNFIEYPDVNILEADARNLPFEKDNFDFVICMTTFANFDTYKVKALLEMKRVLREKGFIIISLYSENALEDRMKIYKKLDAVITKVEEGKVTFAKEVGDNVSEQFSKEELNKLFNEANLKLIDIMELDISYICKLQK